MREEFVEDIIEASTGADASVATEAAVAKGMEAVVGTGEVVVVEDAAKVVDKTNSSSTTDAAEAEKANAATASGETDVAPAESPEVEELASQLGWNKDHKGAESVNASTYILRSKDIQKTMKDHNKDLKGQLNGLQGSVEALKDHNERVYKSDVKKLQGELTKLKADKKAAVELADVAKVEEIDQQIEDVQKDINAPVKKEAATANPVYDEWVAENEWYLTDKDMAAYADTVADQYDGAPPKRIYDLVKQKVAEVFPDKFESAKVVDKQTLDKVFEDKAAVDAEKAAAKVVGPKSPVEAGTRTGDAASFTKADLSGDQVAIMNQFVKGGIMTEEQYIADISKMQGA